MDDIEELTGRNVLPLLWGIKWAFWTTVAFLTGMAIYLCRGASSGVASFAASLAVLLYAGIGMYLTFPFHMYDNPSQCLFLRTIRLLCLPSEEITFVDILAADALTSLSKVFSDLIHLVCLMIHTAIVNFFEADVVFGIKSALIPILLSMALVWPYISRLVQCVRQFNVTGETEPALNALKYLCTIPVILFPTLQSYIIPNNWMDICWLIWFVCGVLNSIYLVYWDLLRDWGLSLNVLSGLSWGRKWVYVWAIVSNIVLRYTWTYKMSALRGDCLVGFVVTSLEIFRRFQWVNYRVENELTRNPPSVDERSFLDDDS